MKEEATEDVEVGDTINILKSELINIIERSGNVNDIAAKLKNSSWIDFCGVVLVRSQSLLSGDEKNQFY